MTPPMVADSWRMVEPVKETVQFALVNTPDEPTVVGNRDRARFFRDYDGNSVRTFRYTYSCPVTGPQVTLKGWALRKGKHARGGGDAVISQNNRSVV